MNTTGSRVHDHISGLWPKMNTTGPRVHDHVSGLWLPRPESRPGLRRSQPPTRFLHHSPFLRGRAACLPSTSTNTTTRTAVQYTVPHPSPSRSAMSNGSLDRGPSLTSRVYQAEPRRMHVARPPHALALSAVGRKRWLRPANASGLRKSLNVAPAPLCRTG